MFCGLIILINFVRFFDMKDTRFMKKIQIILVGLLFFSSLMAQTDFRPGYVVKLMGDTLWGEIDYRGDKTMSEICTFRQNKTADVRTFSPDDIFGYRFVDSKYFVSRKIHEKNVFLEYLIDGKISIYYYREGQFDDHYFIEKEKGELIELPYEKGIKSKDGVEYQYESTTHIGILSFYMQDAPDLLSTITKLKQPEHKNLIKLAEKYHKEVCDGEKCIIYEKKLPPLKVNLEFVAGVTHFNNEFYSEFNTEQTGYFATGGVLAHFWLPRVSENLYFKTGAVFLHDSNSSTTSTILYKIPIQFEYLYPKGIIRPRASLGFDYLIFLPACSVGANIKLNKFLQLTINYDIDFNSENSILNMPNRFCSHSLNGGVCVSL